MTGSRTNAGDHMTRRGAMKRVVGAAAAPLIVGPTTAQAAEGYASGSVVALDRRLRSRFAANRGVQLHYEIAGSGPLILFVHGFPAWWGTWREIMAPLADRFTVAAMDTRGYNLSDRPVGVGNYAPLILASDLGAVIGHAGYRSATVVGHDWGGALAWILGFAEPHLVDRLVILNVPHPWALRRQLAHNPRQRAASAYVRELCQPGSLSRPLPAQLGGGPFTPENLARQLHPIGSPEYRRDVAALRRTSLQAAVNYYVAGYPAPPYRDPGSPPPPVKAPTLVIYGREDPHLLVDGLDQTWDYVHPSVELQIVAGVGHWVQLRAPETVNAAIGDWLARTPTR
jgi:pimeloyl-ACP methyl ester carboxylesterase